MNNRQTAEKIVRQLRAEGFEALLAGGCVRDMLLRRRANDYDVATSAKPGDIMRLFRRTLKVGAKFGVVIVLLGDEQVEVATFRTEGGYADGRHPERVEFSTAEEDATRRDFTINGMFYDPIKRQVIDYVDGRADLKKGLIRTIGKATERFEEDYLRMMRAVRFSTKLGFEIDSETYKAIRRTAEKINLISGERIAMELEGIITNANRETGVEMLLDCGLAEQIFEGFEGQKARSAISVLAMLPVKISFPLGLAGMFIDWNEDEGLQRCERLKLSRGQIKHIKFLLQNRGVLLEAEMSLAKLRRLAAEPYFGDLYQYQRAIQKAAGKNTTALNKIKRRVMELGDIELMPRPLLDGYDLMRLGAAAGPALGQLAEEMYVAQLDGHIKTAEQARQWVRKRLAK
ncbi:MAG: CCA tRNA nucleotidyltransferase [Phycisphaerae bacterium]|jgi:poly(A) polymerase